MAEYDEHRPGSRTPTRQTASVNIPLPSPDIEDQPIYSGTDASSSFLVGSPDQFEGLGGYRTPPRTAFNFVHPSSSVPRSRPLLGSRSTSNPLSSRRRAMSSNHRVVSGLSNIGVGAPQSDQEWTVFGQLMENEGQLPTPSARRRPSTTVRMHPDHPGSLASSSGFTPTRRSNADPFLDIESVAEEDFHGGSRPSSRVPSLQGISATVFDDEYDSSDSCSDSDSCQDYTPPVSPEQSSANWYSLRRIPSVPVLYRNVLKCAIAYFIASLFTFNPYLSELLKQFTWSGPVPLSGGHMVATIAVYFNPAKTQGGMIEADIFCLAGLLYSAFVCLSSMSMFWWLELSPGWEWLGDLVAILWIGFSMSIVAWSKVRMASPSFNTACSMTAIIICVVIIKEGGLRTLLQVTTIVICGSLISNLVCYLIWPQSALYNLRTNMTKTLDSFSTVLTMLTNTFLLEGGVHKKAHLEKMQRAVEDHQGSFTSLKKNLAEARTEWFLRGDVVNARPEDKGKRAYEDAVDSLNRLGQHLNGLRSGTRLQYELTKAGVVKGHTKRRGNNANVLVELDIDTSMDDEEAAMLKSAAAMFGDLVDDLAPPLKALSTSCTTALKRLREAFEQSQSQRRRKGAFREDEFSELVDGIERALSDTPASPRPQSVASQRGRSSVYSSKGEEVENALLLSAENEHVFLVYFFIFTLQEYAREVVSLIDAMGRIYHYERDRVNRGPWWKRLLYHGIGDRLTRLRLRWSSNRPSNIPKRNFPGLKRTFSAYIIPDIRHPVPSFPKVRPHAPNTIQTPPRDNLPLIGRIKQSLWTIGNRMTERDTKYAFKVGMAIAMFAAPAFFDATRSIFVEYWGDWALISFFAVISPTIGATNYLGLQRVLGTLFGAAVAAGIFTLYPNSPAILAVFGFLFSLPCFYYAVAHPQYLSASRFVLLTYNLSCLYCYNLRQKDVSVVNVALHRALAVTAGVLWAGFVSRFWWPAEARRELGKALGEFCLNIGWLYTRLVASNSFAPEYYSDNDSDDAGEGASRLAAPSQSTKLNNSIKEFMAMYAPFPTTQTISPRVIEYLSLVFRELHLQIKLIELQGLLAQTQHEPRLKGPFPILLYRGVLTSLQTILDKLHSIRCVTTREEWYTSVRQDFIIPVNKERREMAGNIILSLSTLASAFRLKAPLPPYLPPVENARQRLVEAIRKLDVVKNRNVKGSRQLLFFAYALTMRGVTEELESLGRSLQTAFGVIGETSEEFDALFMDPEESRKRINYAA
ncbi:hypothetical protein D9615_002507 [Tricholomella constricta]|uniref:DUF2421 domain-containing protein n=1 Tax=Tricholomella constricta TaxID=117010 RepID=A0A8H5M9R9_9AGAR|nr:hypothetical protein D9615_002507 [Tricholomella constricta]